MLCIIVTDFCVLLLLILVHCCYRFLCTQFTIFCALVVSVYNRAEASGRSMVELLALNDAELQAIMLKGDGHRGRDSDRYGFMQERVEDYARDMTRKHMTYDVLYEEYLKSTDNPYGYTQFKAIIQEYERNHDYKYHNVYEPGREMQFDFAGDNLWIVDRDCRKKNKTL